MEMISLSRIYEGWEGYQTSLVHAVRPLTRDQLTWRPAPDRRSIGEIVRHISLGRINWFVRMGAPGIDGVAERVPKWATDSDGIRHIVEEAVAADEPQVLFEWLELSWHPIQRVLEEWTDDDLNKTYLHRWRGRSYLHAGQWTIWRIMAHDIHHGGQLAMLLGILGIEAFELRALGGHLVMPTPASST